MLKHSKLIEEPYVNLINLKLVSIGTPSGYWDFVGWDFRKENEKDLQNIEK